MIDEQVIDEHLTGKYAIGKHPIGKHVDLIAIALLLVAISFCAHARNACLLSVRASHTAWLAPHYHSSTRVMVPALPPIPFTRD